ncbi:MAG: hypothetical protein GTN84_07730 [Hydrogenophaga sp.]|uniref:DMT family transporter n=1 Tax=Hydrogenophaga sp. TaxID=1904254 RepID=UPI001699B6E4|nr:DMT family transporter [Hydrogenophaga sp.]NIM40829.1 hypothetical protein [Hydrogenophaga sp.]NIN26304.1 hypothetical protein [Hydrogenophaga sp.]NIN31169.1 hypothetical protein [Hydrogenophaga sp.]NIN55212.1 hypothetical protein [Hydrogenophaga sp.]NIO51255.1 hypothetical protein [Hydrogenophaga sp.]
MNWTPDRHGLMLTTAFVALWAAEEALTGLLMGRYGLDQIVWMRFVWHIVLLYLLFGRREPALLWRTQRPLFQLARAAMMVGMPACWIMGLHRGLSPAVLMSVFWIAPLMILALARLFLGERASPTVWLAALLACAGVFALTGPHALPQPLLLVFPLGMAMCFSLYVVMTRALRRERTRTNLFYTGLGVCLALAPLVPSGWVTPTPLDVGLVGAVALLGLGGLFALERLTAAAPVSRTAPLVYLQIPFALGFAWALELHDPSLRTLAGVLFTVVVVLYVWRRQRPFRREAGLATDTGFGSL